MWRCRLLGGGERLSKKVCVGSLGVAFIGLCLEWGLEEEESVDLLFGVSGCWCESWKTGNLYYPGLYVCAYALCKAKPVLRVWLCCNFQAKWHCGGSVSWHSWSSFSEHSKILLHFLMNNELWSLAVSLSTSNLFCCQGQVIGHTLSTSARTKN